MKKITLIFIAACAMASCGSNGGNQATIQAQKTADSLKDALVKQQTIDSMNAVAGQKAGSMETQTAGADQGRPHDHNMHKNNNNNDNSGNVNNNPAPNPNPPVVNQVPNPPVSPNPPVVNAAPVTPAPVDNPAPEKKGLNTKAKGALIGAGVGAIGGALLDSKKKGQAVKGGIIGGVIGAAAGFGAGALLDHKKKEKADTTQ